MATTAHAAYTASLAAVVVACGAGSLVPDAGVDSSSDDSGAIVTVPGSLPACSWPASLNPTGSASGQCTAARALLACTSGDGGAQEGCISNDPTQCPSGGPSVPGVSFTCRDRCAFNEYGLVCGGIGPTAPPAATPPAGCVSMGVTPGGTIFYCCPCGTGGGNGGGAGSDAPQPSADAFVSASVGPGNGDPGVCGFGSDQLFLGIGAPLQPKPSTVIDGDSQNGAPVHVSCKVDPSGGGYDIQLSAVLSGGTSGGSLSASGHVTSAGGSGISGAFATAGNAPFRDNNCSITFDYLGAPITVVGTPVAAGRIWGHIECPNVGVSGQSRMAADGATVQRTCEGHAYFLFENCQ